jgi:hypothetical protein
MKKQPDLETIRRLRLGDLRRFLRHRYGHTLPDDDAGRADHRRIRGGVTETSRSGVAAPVGAIPLGGVTAPEILQQNQGPLPPF